MKLRYVAIAVVLLLGCRKEPPAEARQGNGSCCDSGGSGSSGSSGGSANGSAAVGGGSAAAVEAVEIDASVGSAASGSAPAVTVDAAVGGGSAATGSSAAIRGNAAAPPALPLQAQPCPGGQCAAGLTCVDYYGIMGPRGQKFTSCEIRCGADGSCPANQTCVTVADGPGRVCRPRD